MPSGASSAGGTGFPQLGGPIGALTFETGARAYASANPGCLVQVTTHLRRSGRRLPAFHPIELVDASIRGDSAYRLVTRARR